MQCVEPGCSKTALGRSHRCPACRVEHERKRNLDKYYANKAMNGEQTKAEYRASKAVKEKPILITEEEQRQINTKFADVVKIPLQQSLPHNPQIAWLFR